LNQTIEPKATPRATLLQNATKEPAVADSCAHLDQISITARPKDIAGCEDCLRIDARWVHLRMCARCGHIGCCDSSPNRHATAHANETGHPVIRSAEPGEDWFWCYPDELAFTIGPEP
jgi:uncharacterized UBP type Zn finger protein